MRLAILIQSSNGGISWGSDCRLVHGSGLPGDTMTRGVGRGGIPRSTKEQRSCRNRRREWPPAENRIMGGQGGLPRHSAVLQRDHPTHRLKAASSEERPESVVGRSPTATVKVKDLCYRRGQIVATAAIGWRCPDLAQRGTWQGKTESTQTSTVSRTRRGSRRSMQPAQAVGFRRRSLATRRAVDRRTSRYRECKDVRA